MKVNKGMDRSFHYLLLAAQGLFQRTTMAELSGMDLTEEQYRVLDYLGQHDGSLQKYIAAGCQLEPAAAATALDQLERKGLLQRKGGAGAWRAPYVCLTEEGWEKQQLLRQVVEHLEGTVLSALDPEAVHAMRDGLAEVCLSLAAGREELQ